MKEYTYKCKTCGAVKTGESIPDRCECGGEVARVWSVQIVAGGKRSER